tara:strand:+ start:259 stop:609 length:351 start_codon:yes stop_codon:yes gene_type:complete
MSEWEYVRTNSKGEAVFRKDTNESLEFVENYLQEKNIQYCVSMGASLLWIENEEGREYVYYWTTGRWSPRKPKYKVHYRSNGIDDFVTRFLNRFVEQNKIERELKNEQNDNKRVSQ